MASQPAASSASAAKAPAVQPHACHCLDALNTAAPRLQVQEVGNITSATGLARTGSNKFNQLQPLEVSNFILYHSAPTTAQGPFSCTTLLHYLHIRCHDLCCCMHGRARPLTHWLDATHHCQLGQLAL